MKVFVTGVSGQLGYDVMNERAARGYECYGSDVLPKEKITLPYNYIQLDITKQEDIEAVLNNGQFAVMPLDMCGAIAMKRHFPTAIIYVSKDKEQLIKEIIDDDYDTSEKTLRILSIDAEKRNKQICDYIIDNSSNDGAAILRDLIYGR